jgi:hypothetical protein
VRSGISHFESILDMQDSGVERNVPDEARQAGR